MTPPVPRPALEGLTRQERTLALRAYKDQVAAASRPAAPPARLATRGRRRALAAASLSPLVLATVAAALRPARVAPLLLLVAFAVFMVLFFALRRATTLLTDVPDGALDERELAERGQIFRLAYLGVSALLSLTMLATLVDDFTGGRFLDDGGATTLLIGVFVTSLLVPSAVTAWRWQDDAPEADED